MKNKASLIVIILVIGVVVGSASLLIQFNDLQTQLLRQTETGEISSGSTSEPIDCKKLSEDAANRCFQEMALDEKDVSRCDQITKVSQAKTCRREVELSP